MVWVIQLASLTAYLIVGSLYAKHLHHTNDYGNKTDQVAIPVFYGLFWPVVAPCALWVRWMKSPRLVDRSRARLKKLAAEAEIERARLAKHIAVLEREMNIGS